MARSGTRTGFDAARSLIYVIGFVALWTWVARLVRPLDARIPLRLPAWLGAFGVGFAIVGALVVLACVATFFTRGEGTPAPFDPPRAFVATGPYRFVRNPMYLGAAAALFGAGLIVASPAIVLLAVGFLGLAHLFVLAYEEPTLARTFGASYEEYRATVRRWRPRRPPDPGGAGDGATPGAAP
jgi:protein-S-isoprenylcysteine O-methyltransferase Ste14